MINPARKHPRAPLAEYRNRRGEEVQVEEFSATEAKNAFGAVLEAAIEHGVAVITRHQTPKAVLLSLDEFNSLVGARDATLESLTAGFNALLDRLQTSSVRRGLRAAFGASPKRMGKAAAAAARRRG